MIAYLEKYDTTVDVPDNISQSDLSDINENFHSYVAPKTDQPQANQPTQPATSQPEAAPTPESQPKWQPNFYEGMIKPSLDQLLGAPAKMVADVTQSPQAEAFAGKALEEGTFGLAKPLVDPVLGEAFKEHPAFADAGAMAGGVGSLLATGGALRIAGLGTEAALAGKAAVEGGFEAGSRFIPKAIMTGATFGTRTFIAETVKAFEEGGVNLEQFGKDVLKDTAFGAMFGSIGGLTNAAASISSAGALGFLSSKMSGSDNREATLNAAIWGAFETVGSVGKSEALRMEALSNLKESIGEYIGNRNPEMQGEAASKAASAFVDHSISKAGFDNAEDLAKSGPENLLEGIEKVNQAVRTAKIPTPPPATGEPLPKLPAPIEPEVPRGTTAETALTRADYGLTENKPVILYRAMTSDEHAEYERTGIVTKGSGARASTDKATAEFYAERRGPGTKIISFTANSDDIQAAGNEPGSYEIRRDINTRQQPPKPQTPLEKAIDTVKGMMGLKIETPTEPKPPTVTGNTYDEKIQSLKDQGQDISKMPESMFPEDMKDVYHFEQGKAQGAEMDKNLGEIAERFQALGVKPNEGKAIFDAYGLDKKGSLGQTVPLSDLAMKPIEDQYVAAYQAIAVERGIDKGDKFDAKTMDQAKKSVDLINGYFNPQSQEVKEFATQHQDLSDHDVAQMAYNRDLLESPNPDLLKTEIQKAKQEKVSFDRTASSGATIERPTKEKPATPISVPSVAENLNAYKSEITNLVTPYKAAPLAAANMREKLGLMARRMDMAEAAMEDAKKLFSKWTPEQVTEFYDKAEHGLPQATPELDTIEEALQKPLRDLQQEINKETGRLAKPIENYLPHAWEQGDDAIPTAIKNASKRPWQGSKSFLKKRTIDTFKEGVQAGLIPTSWNPVDLAMDKLREMSKFLAAHQTLNELKKTKLAVYTRAGEDHPKDFIKINDGISDVYRSPMIAVQEAYDAKVMGDLESVANNLGVDLERSTHAKENGLGSGTLGFSKSEVPGKPGKVWTRFAGPESTLAHELGHQIDNIYDLQSKFLSNPKIDKELSDLAHERREGDISAKDKAYIESKPEKMAVMFEAYVHAPSLFKEKAPTAYSKLEDFLKSDPKLEPLTKIEPSLVKEINKSEVYAGGNVIAGHYYVQPDAARIINNYLSPGLNKSKIIKSIRTIGNVINQFQLGFSAFHMNFTSSEAIATQIGEAIDALAHGDIRSFSTHMGKAPIAPVSTVIRGDEMLKAWRGKGQSAIDEMLANILAISGGRAHMDKFYGTGMVEQMRNNFKSGQYVQGILRAPLAAVDAASKPIMEHLVPRMKIGIFAEMMETELKNNPNMTHEQMRDVGGKIWDTIDDRMGQVVYDNLFWNKSFKDALMLTFRSVGWNHGLVRLTVGSAADAVAIVNDTVHGRMPKSENFSRLKYWLGSAIFTFTANALYQYVKTGKGPSELKDYVFPKNGGVDSSGNPTRSIPFQNYFKDLYHMKTHPVTTLENKLQPMWSIISQALNNKDYFGTQIVNPQNSDTGMEGLINQIGKEVEFLTKSVLPFSATNMMHNLSQGNKSIESVLGPWVGDIPAPYDIDQTKAQEKAHEIIASHQEIGGRTEEQAERSKLVGELSRQYRTGDPSATDNIFKAYQEGAISHRQMQNIITESRLTPLQRMVKNMTLEEAEQVYKKSNDEEKAQIELTVEKKKMAHSRNFVTSQ